MQALTHFYVGMSGDPLVGRVMGIFGNESELAWFKSFMYLEAYGPISSPSPAPFPRTPSDHTEHRSLFQLPVFVLGARGLWRGKSSPIWLRVIVNRPWFFRLARNIRPPCAVRRIDRYNHLCVSCGHHRLSYDVRRHHRAEGRLSNVSTACHTSGQLRTIFYHSIGYCSGYGVPAAKIGICGCSCTREFQGKVMKVMKFNPASYILYSVASACFFVSF